MAPLINRFNSALRRLNLKSVSGVIVVMVTWEAVATLGPPGLFPHLVEIARAVLRLCSDRVFLQDAGISIRRAGGGYIIGCVTGILFGIATATKPVLGASISPVLRWARSLPPIALAPFLILLLGLGEGSKFSLIAFGVVFPVWIAAHAGLLSIDDKLVWSARTFGASRGEIVRLVLVPASLPYILVGMRTAIGVALTCLVGAEISGASSGLMYRIEIYRLTFETDKVVAGLVLLCCVGAGADWLFIWTAERLSPGVFRRARLSTGWRSTELG